MMKTILFYWMFLLLTNLGQPSPRCIMTSLQVYMDSTQQFTKNYGMFLVMKFSQQQQSGSAKVFLLGMKEIKNR